MRRALVTGGSGFIGRYLVSELAARGDAVRILDIRPPRHAASEAEYIEGSILDRPSVRQALEGIEDVYHLAALPGMWMDDREDFHAVNCRGTEAMLAAAKEHGVPRFLHCSTESILFDAGRAKSRITDDPEPRSSSGVYTRSKLDAEQAARSAAANGLSVVIVNPTLPVGPHDYNFTPPTTMIRSFLRWRIHCYIDLTLNLVDVRDVAQGMILAMERGRIGESYILGGANLSLTRLLDLLATITGRSSPRIRIPAPLALITASVMEFMADHVTHRAPAATVEGVRLAMRSHALSIDKSRRELGYQPRSIEPALREATAWIEERYRVGAV